MMNNEMTRNELVAAGFQEINKADIVKADAMAGLMNPESNFYCSIPDDGSRKSKVKIYNAINSPDYKLADYIGKPLEIIDVVAHPITITDEQTGEIIETVRVVLVDKNGAGYEAVSGGIVNSLQKIFGIIGMPEGGAWHAEPVKMEVKQVQTRNGNNKVNTLVLI